MNHVLVTGATGFLGHAVVDRLAADGRTVTAHGRTQNPIGADVLVGDLADPVIAQSLLGGRSWDAVVNLAGPVTGGAEDLRTGIEVVTAHVRIAQHLRRHLGSCRIVHASSMTVYGLPDAVVVDESSPRRPLHLYGLAKMLAEDVLLAAPNLDAWILRLPGLFSETRRTGALYHFCRAARAGAPLTISTLAPTAWNVLHVADAADAIARALVAPSSGAISLNVSYNEPMDLVSVARRVAEIAGAGSPVDDSPALVHPSLHLLSDRARALLGWQPPSLQQRLTTLYAALAT